MAGNHPNRDRRASSPGSSPAPEIVKATHESLNLTQKDAAALIYSSERTWQDAERGVFRLHPAKWELFRMKTGLLKLEDVHQ